MIDFQIKIPLIPPLPKGDFLNLSFVIPARPGSFFKKDCGQAAMTETDQRVLFIL